MNNKLTFDFGDGKGPVPAHQHSNGGGWVADTATVDPTAWVGPSAKVYGCAGIFGHAKVYGNARVYGNTIVYGNAAVCGDAEVYGNAMVCRDAVVSGDAAVFGDAVVSGNAQVYGDARVFGDAVVSGHARVCGDTVVYGKARVHDNIEDARVHRKVYRKPLVEENTTRGPTKPEHTETIVFTSGQEVPSVVLEEAKDRGEKAIRRRLRSWPLGKTLVVREVKSDCRIQLSWHFEEESL